MRFYIGTYTYAAFTPNGGKGIYALDLDGSNGKFTGVSLAAETEDSSFVTRKGECFWSVSEYAGKEGEVHSWRLQPDGTLQRTGTVSCGGVAPCHLTAGNGWLAVANYMTGSLGRFVLTNGVAENETVYPDEGHGPDEKRQEAPHVHSSCLAPDGHLLVADLGTDELVVYLPGKDGFEKIGTIRVPGGYGPRHMAFSADGSRLYVVTEMAAHLLTYAYADGKAELLRDDDMLPEGFEGVRSGADIHLAPDGSALFASNRGHDSVVRFELENGLPVRPRWFATGGEIPRGFNLSSDGKWLVVGHQKSGGVTCLNACTGEITDRAEIPMAVCVTF